MKRIAYDADTQKYTFRDADGTLYESAPGSRYGELTPVRSSDTVDSPPASPSDDTRVGRYKGPAHTFEEIEARHGTGDHGNGEAVRTVLPFALLVLVSMLLLFRLVNGGFGWTSADDADMQVLDCGQGGRQVQVERGDSCWKIASDEGLGVEELLGLEGNGGVDCDVLRIGQGICVPA
jgi:hypothetical protein